MALEIEGKTKVTVEGDQIQMSLPGGSYILLTPEMAYNLGAALVSRAGDAGHGWVEHLQSKEAMRIAAIPLARLSKELTGPELFSAILDLDET